MWVSIQRPWDQRGNTYINKGEKMDDTHKQVLRKGCCAQKIDLQRKKEGGKTSRFVLVDLERTGECIKTMYCANHFQKLSKKQAEKKRMNNFSVSYPYHL